MRPSSSSVANPPNRSNRSNRPVLIDFLAKEVAEQQERANAHHPKTRLAGLDSRTMSLVRPAHESVNFG